MPNTDTQQWCQLHRGHCNNVVVMRRHFEDPTRQDEIFLACPKCVRDLKKAELIADSKYAGIECHEIVVPKAFSKGRKAALSYGLRDPHKPCRPGQSSSTAGSLLRSRQQSYEVTLDALQVKYLRALGLRVILA